MASMFTATTGTKTITDATLREPFSTQASTNTMAAVLVPLQWLQILKRLEQVLDPSWKWKRLRDGDV